MIAATMSTAPISDAAMTYGRSVDVGREYTRLPSLAAAHASFDSVEKDFECGYRLSNRLDRNLGDDRIDRFRLGVERDLDGATVDAQLISVGRLGRPLNPLPMVIGRRGIDRIVVQLHARGAGAD